MKDRSKPPADEEVIRALIEACACGMDWMGMIGRQKIRSATRGLLDVDIGTCQTAITKAQNYLKTSK